MTFIDRPGAGLPRAPVTVDLDDIQATVLRHRPEPYYGTHIMLHVDEAKGGREFVRRVTPHVDSAAGQQAGKSWISVAISYAGLVALGVPEDSLLSFPEAFRAGMAAFGSGLIHIGVSVFSDSESMCRRTMGTARRQYEGFPGVTVLIEQDFGAQPGDLNPLSEAGVPLPMPRPDVLGRNGAFMNLGSETFNGLRGGEYFFMPSLSALRWLADL